MACGPTHRLHVIEEAISAPPKGCFKAFIKLLLGDLTIAIHIQVIEDIEDMKDVRGIDSSVKIRPEGHGNRLDYTTEPGPK